MLISAGIISIVASLALLGVSRAQKTRGATYCVSNLRSIGMAFQAYTIDNTGSLPNPAGTTSQWEDLLRNYVHRSTFQCPNDDELYVALGSSYDWRDTGPPDQDHRNSFAGRPMHAIRMVIRTGTNWAPGNSRWGTAGS